jgi:ATP synthase protein I
MTDTQKLIEETDRDLKRLAERQRKPATLLGMVLYGGTIGLLLAAPIVVGAYLGRWIDSLFAGYSVRWTISFIVLGIVIGSYNVVRFIRSRS